MKTLKTIMTEATQVNHYFENIKQEVKFLLSELEDLEFFSDETTPRIVKQAQAEHFDRDELFETLEDHVENISSNVERLKKIMSKPKSLQKGNMFSRRD